MCTIFSSVLWYMCESPLDNCLAAGNENLRPPFCLVILLHCTTAVLLVVLNISTQRAYCSYYDPICELQNNNGRRRSNGKVNCVVKNLLQSETCEKNAATRVLFLSTDLESNIIHLST